MKIAITGGTGFVGRHLARELSRQGHQVVLIARGLDHRDEQIRTLSNTTFVSVGIENELALREAFAGCDAVAHCAGINREIKPGDYQRVHVEGTRNVINAATYAHVQKIALLSFFRARPDCGSGYHESKWAAEELIRGSQFDYTILKCGMIFGLGDHMLDHLSHSLHTLPLFGTVGLTEKEIFPVAVQDVVKILCASLTQGRLSRQTVAVRGPEDMLLSEAVRKVGAVIGKRPLIFPLPIAFQYAMAVVLERTMKVPLISLAQVQMLSEGFSETYATELLAEPDLKPATPFSDEQIKAGLPPQGPFTLRDLRWCS